MTTAGITGNRGKVGEAPEDAFVELPVGFTEGNDCVDVMPEDMATVAIGMFAVDVEAIVLFNLDAGLVSGNLKFPESAVVVVGVVPVVLTVLVTAPLASPLFTCGTVVASVCSTDC